MSRPHLHFVTGRLAERALRATVGEVAEQLQFDWTMDVLPITVAALMTPTWISQRIAAPSTATRIIIPGYCDGDLQPLTEVAAGISVERGPHDLRQLPEYLGAAERCDHDYGRFSIEIVAEINHAPRLGLPAIVETARNLVNDGADVIDIGCEPGPAWSGVGDCVKALRDLNLRVSIDSFNPREIEPAVRGGAELVLSVNATNREAARDWGCEVVAIPDEIHSLGGLDETLDLLARHNVPLRIDAILEPIGLGFAASLHRYLLVRRRYPDAEMLMGVGNLTELTDVDSAGVNVLLLGFCEELGIRSVLTTQVINWARSSVKECDLARRLVRYAIAKGVPPKNVDSSLVMLRDARLHEHGDPQLDALADQIKDHNYRLFAENGRLHLVSAGSHLQDADPFLLFQQLVDTKPKNLDSSHAFYLGFELAKALTAMTLGKQYNQDEPLDWGALTRPERSHRLASRRRATDQ